MKLGTQPKGTDVLGETKQVVGHSAHLFEDPQENCKQALTQSYRLCMVLAVGLNPTKDSSVRASRLLLETAHRLQLVRDWYVRCFSRANKRTRRAQA